MSNREESERSRHEQRLSRTFDEVMKLGEFSDTAGSGCSSGSNDQVAGRGEDSEGSGREERTDRAGETLPRTSPPSTSPPDTLSGAGQGSGGLEDELDGLPVFGVDEEEEDWHFALPMDTLAELDIDRPNNRPDELTERQKDVRDKVQTDGQADEDRVFSQGESRGSATHTSSPDSLDGAVLNHSEGGGLSPNHSKKRPESDAPADRENPAPPIPPLMNIKDEPIDEGYDSALLPQTSSLKQIKEELEHQEDELRISSVYSVGGGNSYVSPTVPAPAPQTPSILGAGRSLAPAPPPPPPVQPAPPATPQAQPPPSGGANPSSVRCSGCSKVLLKGQTAYQRKGSTQLFCSTVCLTGFLPNTVLGKTCHQCLKEIENPKNLISVPMGTGGAQKDFCSQFCLSVFNRRKKNDFLERPSCSVCKRTNRVQHEVTYQGTLHRLCSDHCFSTWRHYRQLAMNCCENCGMYCNSKGGSSQVLTIGDVALKFCSPTCIATYKQTCSSMMDCAHCKNKAVMSSMLVSNDLQGKIKLYCSSACVSYSRPPQHVLTGTAFPCTHCRVNAVPQYHLAMVDGSIRNFCSHACVTTFRSEQSKALVQGSGPPPVQMNGASTNPMAPPPPPPYYDSLGAGSGPYGHSPHPSFRPPAPGHPYAPSQPAPAPHPPPPGVARAYGQQQQQGLAPLSSTRLPGPVRLTCNQCSLQFSFKPELLLHKGRIFQFCGKQCCDQFKTRKNIVMKCEYCLLEKVVKDLIVFNHRARAFCSESCKLLFKHDLTKKNKESPWRSCAFCSGICQNTAGQKMIHSHFGGKMEEFCKPDCMSMFTVLFYEMARCDNCRRQGKMTEQLRCSGTIRHFCNMDCVLQYCYRNIQNPIKGSAAQHSKMAPVIADVVSLANTPTGQPSTADTPLTGTLPTSNSHGKSLDDASTQTDAMRLPAANRRNMKNKAILCKPFTRSQDTMCHLPTQTTETPAGFSECTFNTTINEEKVKVVVLPVPVPVFIPVPMNMYSQYTPVPMMMPIPVPVPMVLHSTQSVSESKDKKDPLVQSQSMAEDDEEAEKDKPISHGDQGSTYSGDLESEAVSTPLSWEEESTSGPSTQLGLNPETADPPSVMDLEADIPTECFESSRWNPSSSFRKQRLAGRKRPRDGFPPSKRSRTRTGSGETSHGVLQPAARQLHHMYGVEAWKSWVLQSSKDPPPGSTGEAAGPVVLKEDVLQCDSSELSYGLCRFIGEVRRPNGQHYSPDSIFYLCLGIQQYLFKNGRIENIFTDEFYNQFTMEITRMLEHWRPTVLPSGYLHSRVEEDYLWECKQLGAYSPTVLLNTLIFFSTKIFGFTGAAQHRQLSFANFTRCTRLTKTGKMAYLRFRPPRGDEERTELLPALPAKRKMEEEEGDMEMPENIENPLRCPVRLYLFYLSKCSESVRKRDDLFYLQPVVSCHPNSPQWYCAQPLEDAALESMLTRILAVRQVHLDRTQQQQSTSAPSTDDDSSQ